MIVSQTHSHIDKKKTKPQIKEKSLLTSLNFDVKWGNKNVDIKYSAHEAFLE